WVYSKGKDLDGKGFNQDLVNYIDLGMTYSFNKNFSTYVDYKINMLDNDEALYDAYGISTDDIVGVGMTYQF
ncbi:porin, partial [Klebsiella pneumoniae]|uniref:porin n=3 Tax=Enterobacteriaceae TaxID=543 RepID=UPI001BA52946